jgi:ABC-type transport system involved in multi-copper enzyme maturation permease subunit
MWILLVVILAPIFASTVQLCTEHEFSGAALSPANGATLFVLICGSGAIGSQISDGTLSLVLSRPLTIRKYIFSKWFAIAVASTTAALIQLVSEVIVELNRTPAALNLSDVLINGTERALFCFGFSAVMILFSAVASGFKDLGLYFILVIINAISMMLAQIKPESVPEGVGRTIVNITLPASQIVNSVTEKIIQPGIDLSPLIAGTILSLHEFATYFAVIAAFLSLAIYSLNRRELPYGAD